ncbi:hypothetical protein Nmel_015348, partial [Mimus melanotis]
GDLRLVQPPSGSLIAGSLGERPRAGFWPSWWCQAAACASQRPEEQLSPAVVRGRCPLRATGRVSGSLKL